MTVSEISKCNNEKNPKVISLRKDGGKRGKRRGIKIGLVRAGKSVGGVERAQHFLPAGLEGLFVLASAFHEDQHLVGIGIGDISGALDFGVAEPLSGET